MQDVAATSPEKKALIADMRTVIAAYTAIAIAAVPSEAKAKGSMPLRHLSSSASSQLARRERVPVLSVPLPPQPDCVYEGLPYITRVRPDVSFVGGNNVPKLLVVEDNMRRVIPCSFQRWN